MVTRSFEEVDRVIINYTRSSYRYLFSGVYGSDQQLKSLKITTRS